MLGRVNVRACIARRLAALIAVALAAIIVCGCAARKRFEVVQMAPTTPVASDSVLVLLPPIVGNITVNGEDEQLFASHFTAAEWTHWVDLLGTARDGFVEGVRATKDPLHFAPGDGPHVQFAFEAIQLARLDQRSSPKTMVTGILRVQTPRGDVLEAVRLRAFIEPESEVVAPGEIEATRSRRFMQAGIELGRKATEYLKSRAGVL